MGISRLATTQIIIDLSSACVEFSFSAEQHEVTPRHCNLRVKSYNPKFTFSQLSLKESCVPKLIFRVFSFFLFDFLLLLWWVYFKSGLNLGGGGHSLAPTITWRVVQVIMGYCFSIMPLEITCRPTGVTSCERAVDVVPKLKTNFKINFEACVFHVWMWGVCLYIHVSCGTCTCTGPGVL